MTLTLTFDHPGKDGQGNAVTQPAPLPSRSVSHLNLNPNPKLNHISNHYNTLLMLMSSVICHVTT